MPTRPPLRPRLLRPWSAHIAHTQTRAGGSPPSTLSAKRQANSDNSLNDAAAAAAAKPNQSEQTGNHNWTIYANTVPLPTNGTGDYSAANLKQAKRNPSTRNQHELQSALGHSNGTLESQNANIDAVSSRALFRRVFQPGDGRQGRKTDLNQTGDDSARTVNGARSGKVHKDQSSGNTFTQFQPLGPRCGSHKQAEFPRELSDQTRDNLSRRSLRPDSPSNTPLRKLEKPRAIEASIRRLLLPELRALKGLRKAIEKRTKEAEEGHARNPSVDRGVLAIERSLSDVDVVLQKRWGIKLSDVDQGDAAMQQRSGALAKECGDLPSLMEELFPEQSKKTESKPQDDQQEPPRLQLPFNEQLAEQDVRYLYHRRRQGKFTKQEDLPEVLVLRSASRSLTEADFRCLLPRGKHIREWSNAADELMKVIPARDPISLEHQGTYFILFSHAAAARQYAKRAKEVHRLCKEHTPNSLISPLPPPPGILTDGEDIHSLTKTFTLATPSQRLDLRHFPKPYSPRILQMIRSGGVPSLMATVGFKVLLRMAGHSDLTRSKIMGIIGNDGRDRGQPWDLVMGPTAVMNLQQLVTELSSEGRIPGTRDRSRGDNVSDDVVDGDEISKGAEKDIWQKAQMRWLVSFNDVTEAKRFAAAWNGKAIFSGTYAGPEENEIPTTVHAEYMW